MTAGAQKKYVIPVLVIFLSVLSAGYLYNLHSFAANYWGFVIGDWFIGFQSGFVRRGLSGFMLMHVSDVFNAKPCYTLLTFQSILYLSYLSLFILLVSRKKTNPWFLIALLSPATLLFTTFDPNAAGRKEILLFFIFVIYLWCLEKDLLKSFLPKLIFFLALLLATLFHELVFFYSPYFLLATFVYALKNKRPFKLFNSLVMVAGPGLILIAIGLYGITIDGNTICADLKSKGLPESICSGILSWPQEYGWRDVARFARESHYGFVYGTTFLLSMIPYILLVKSFKHPALRLKKFMAAVGLLLLFSSPLFLFAVDWGRWLNIHFMLLLFTSALMLEPAGRDPESGEDLSVLNQHVTMNSKGPFIRKRKMLLYSVLWLTYIALWSMPHFGYSDVFSITKNFYSIKHMITDVLMCIR